MNKKKKGISETVPASATKPPIQRFSEHARAQEGKGAPIKDEGRISVMDEPRLVDTQRVNMFDSLSRNSSSHELRIAAGPIEKQIPDKAEMITGKSSL